MKSPNTPKGYIPAIERKILDSTQDAKENLVWPDAIKKAEMDYIRQRRGECVDSTENTTQKANDAPLVGLALSGGGIRSATFSLGIMQALVARGLLRKVDYLSTVSGGGYIGSALTWLLSDGAQQSYQQGRKGADNGSPDTQQAATHENSQSNQQCFGLSADNFPFGSDDPAPERPKAASLEQRRMLQYLRNHGYYMTPGAGISALSLIGIVLRGTFLNLAVWMPVFVLFFLLGMWYSASYSAQLPDMVILPWLLGMTPHAALRGFDLFLILGAGALLLVILMTLAYSVITKFRRGSDKAKKWYQRRREAEQWSAMALAIIVLLLLVGSLPWIKALLDDAMASVGAVTMLAGIGAAVRDFIKPSEGSSGSGGGLLGPIAAALFLFGGFLLSYSIAFGMVVDKDDSWLIPVGLLLFSLLFGWLVNLNYISIHRYYRDRLMETFMPDIGSAQKDSTGAAYGANEAKLSDFADAKTSRGPYHLVNTNVVLVDSEQRIYRNRGGDNFLLSPLYCGSNATGWCPTRAYMDGKMTLATAMAISGAAANPNTGVGGVGLTRNRIVSFVMSLLNLRLGYWADHPCTASSHSPNHFIPGLYAFGNAMGGDRWGFREERGYLALSDGGHFENTGVYELIRRRVGLIIACDGGADREFSFSDFQTTIRRIDTDFGTRIRVLDHATPDQIVPMPVDDHAYPKEAQFAQQGHMIGCIEYPDGSKGWLIFLKTTLIRDLSFKVKGYAAKNPEFPDQSTLDQNFDEVQFEAYRELGYRLASKMLESPAPADGPNPKHCGEIPKEPAKGNKTLDVFIREFGH